MSEANKQIEVDSAWRLKGETCVVYAADDNGVFVVGSKSNQYVGRAYFNDATLLYSPSSPPVEVARGVCSVSGDFVGVGGTGMDEAMEKYDGDRVRVLVAREVEGD